jgi:hypothetical protein
MEDRIIGREINEIDFQTAAVMRDAQSALIALRSAAKIATKQNNAQDLANMRSAGAV